MDEIQETSNEAVVEQSDISSSTGSETVAKTPASESNLPFDEYKNDNGEYDFDKIFKDLKTEKDRSDGLRKKLSEAKKVKPFEVSDLSVMVPDDEKEVMTDLVKTFNEAGISKDQTEKILSKLSEYAIDEKQLETDQEDAYQAELKKLGTEKDTIINGLKTFTDTMVANKVWDDQQRKVFADAICSADVAKTFYNAIQNINVIKAGSFSSTTPAQNITQEYSNQDKIDMYKRAFELSKTNKSDGELEIKRLDKIFGIR